MIQTGVDFLPAQSRDALDFLRELRSCFFVVRVSQVEVFINQRMRLFCIGQFLVIRPGSLRGEIILVFRVFGLPRQFGAGLGDGAVSFGCILSLRAEMAGESSDLACLARYRASFSSFNFWICLLPSLKLVCLLAWSSNPGLLLVNPFWRGLRNRLVDIIVKRVADEPVLVEC